MPELVIGSPQRDWATRLARPANPSGRGPVAQWSWADASPITQKLFPFPYFYFELVQIRLKPSKICIKLNLCSKSMKQILLGFSFNVLSIKNI
jgi:hypothetical protein